MRSYIREARRKRGWSQIDLMRESGLAYNTVAFAERGIRITDETAAILSRVLGIRVAPIDSEDVKRRIRQRIEKEQHGDSRPSSSGTLQVKG